MAGAVVSGGRDYWVMISPVSAAVPAFSGVVAAAAAPPIVPGSLVLRFTAVDAVDIAREEVGVREAFGGEDLPGMLIFT